MSHYHYHNPMLIFWAYFLILSKLVKMIYFITVVSRASSNSTLKLRYSNILVSESW